MPFGKKNTNQNIPKTSTPNLQANMSAQDKIRLGQLSKRYNKTRLRLLMWIIGCILVLVGLIAYAAIKAGGVQNLFQGNQDIVTNTFNNVGSAVVNQTTPTTTVTPTPLTFNEVTPINNDQKTLGQNINTLTITVYNSDSDIKIKKNSTLVLVNSTGKVLGLEFSNGAEYRLEIGDKQAVVFAKAGTYTYRDVVNSQLNDITGTVTVVD